MQSNCIPNTLCHSKIVNNNQIIENTQLSLKLNEEQNKILRQQQQQFKQADKFIEILQKEYQDWETLQSSIQVYLCQQEYIDIVKDLKKRKIINDEEASQIIIYIQKNQSLSKQFDKVFRLGFYSFEEFLQLIEVQQLEQDRVLELNLKEFDNLVANRHFNSSNLIRQTFHILSTYSQINEANKFSLSSQIELSDTILLCKKFMKQFNYYPKPIQLLSVLELYEHGSKGRIVEIYSGEGKTSIIALLAILLIKKKQMNIDIITSSPSLAIQNTKQFKQFYQQFSISVSHNINDQNKLNEEINSYYQSQVIYGDILSFQEGILRNKQQKYGSSKHRIYGYVILNDEIDSLMIAGNQMHSDINKTEIKQNIALSNLYKERLLGITGSLGSKAQQNFLSKHYNIDFVFIPFHSQSQIVEVKGLALLDEKEWLERISQAVQEQILNNRAVLIIAKTKGVVSKIESIFSRNQKVIKYLKDDQISQNEIQPQTIIIVPYEMIRQVVIKISTNLEKNGGIHVIMSFLPQNSRLEDLGFSRILRQGINGSKQLIVQFKDSLCFNSQRNYFLSQECQRFQENIRNQNLESLKLLRNKQEEYYLEEAEEEIKIQGKDYQNFFNNEKQNQLFKQNIPNSQDNNIVRKVQLFYDKSNSYIQNTQDSIANMGYFNNLENAEAELINLHLSRISLLPTNSTQHNQQTPINLNKQDVYMIEKDEQFVCLNHSEYASQVLLDEQLKGQEKLVCNKCLNQRKDSILCQPLQSIIEKIERRKLKPNDQLAQFFHGQQNYLDTKSQIILQQKQNLFIHFDQIERAIQKSKEQIYDLYKQQYLCSVFKELNLLNVSEDFLLRVKKDRQKRQLLIFINRITHKQLHKFSQQQLCQVLTFNFDDSKVIAGTGKQIKVWDFQQDKIIDNQIILQGHSEDIRCIVVSKNRNWLVSGGDDSLLMCWNQLRSNWEKSWAKQVNSGSITQIILNDKEDQLIFCSSQGKIGILRINQDNNYVQEIQNLQKHKKKVNCVSLSKSYDLMVSCSEDDQIIIWGKTFTELWEFKQLIITQGKRIQRVFFQSNNTIITQATQGQIEGYIKNNDQFIYSNNLRFELNSLQNLNSNDYELVYNEMRQFFLIKQYEKLFFIQRLNLSQNQNIIKNCMDCGENIKVFNISRNGNYLIAQIGQSKPKFRVYEIKYDQ
ncbi:unnamed protein product [Paramecium primaurelia]|uniref:SecA DEAD-like N-terminal domain-containing protein n=1 Tax=Paramecium primaurelia TaxID=5886 RepID=A0A8S1NBQ6_PARPR|nr:unnamed protein product [Paramecium primaurelia]